MGSVQDDKRVKFLEGLGLTTSTLSNPDLLRAALLESAGLTATTGAVYSNADLNRLVGYPQLDSFTGFEFNPFKSITTGLLGLWDASSLLGEGVALPSGGSGVSQWNDLSGNGRHLVQATANKQPLFRTTQRNLMSYSAATFEGPLASDSGSIICGWGTGTGAAPTAISTAWAAGGMASLLCTTSAAGGVYVEMKSAAQVLVTAGNTYGAVVTVYNPGAAARTFRIYVIGNGSGYTVRATAATQVIASLGTATFTLPFVGNAADTVGVGIRVDMTDSAAAAETFHIDNAGIFDITPVWTAGGTGGNLLNANQAAPVASAWNAFGTPTASIADATSGVRVALTGATAGQGAGITTNTPALPVGNYVGYARIRSSSTIRGAFRVANSTAVVTGAPVTTTSNVAGVEERIAVPFIVTTSGTVTLSLRNALAGSSGDYFEINNVSIHSSDALIPAWIAPVTLANNRPAVQFDGATTILQSVGNHTHSGFTAYAVFRRETTVSAAETRPFSWRSSLANASGPYINVTNTNVVVAAKNDDASFPTNTTPATTTNWNILVGSWQNGATLLAYLNGVPDLVGSTYTVAPPISGPIVIGGAASGATGASFFIGTVALIAAYDGVHTDATRKRIEKYLGTRFGITVTP